MTYKQSINNQSAYFALAALLLISVPFIDFLPTSILLGYSGILAIRTIWQKYAFKLPSTWLIIMILLIVLTILWMTTKSLIGREGGVAFLMVLISFKSFETDKLRDWRILISLGFFLSSMPLLFDQAPYTTSWVILVFFLLISSLSALTGETLWRSMKQAGTVMLLSLPLMVVLFISVPRLPGPIFGLETPNKTMTGIGDEMTPGKFSELIQNDTPAFTAVFDATQPSPSQQDLYWRVAIFDTYNGTSWFFGGETYRTENATLPKIPSKRYTITSALDKGRWPALDYPSSVPSELNSYPGFLLRSKSPSNETLRLNMQSIMGNYIYEDLTEKTQQYYLMLPLGNDLTRDIVKKWKTEANSNERKFISSVLNHFRQQQFTYTLRPALLNGQNKIDDFMFKTKEGFCEHYASAFAFMMRTAGLPTRVIAGYQGGEFNPQAKFWQVRSKDAHAWTEVWLPSEKIWLRVDPTAAIAPERIQSGIEQAVPEAGNPLFGKNSPPWMQQLHLRWQALGFQWEQWVIGYDFNRQHQFFNDLGLQFNSYKNIIVILISGIMLALIPIYIWYRISRPQISPFIQGWNLLKYKLSRVDIAIRDSDGPMDVLAKIKRYQKDSSNYEKLERLIEQYIQLIYMTKDYSKQNAKTWYAKIKRLRLHKRK